MVEVIIGPASQIVAAPIASCTGEDQFDDAAVVTQLRQKTAHLQPRRPLTEPHPETAHTHLE